MRKADEILKDLKEAQYQVYNKQEETEEGLTPENRQTYNSEDIRNMFMGTLLTGNFKGDKLWGSLRDAINKMSDEWVLEFLKVVNGDTIEKVNESVNEEEQKTLHDKAFRPIYVGDYVAHIKGGYNSAVSIEIGKVIAIDIEKEKIQVDKKGSKSWIKPSLCILTLDREEVKLPEPTYADGRPILNHNMYDLGLQDAWVKQ